MSVKSSDTKQGWQKGKKTAIVCDWLTNVGGAEKVLLEIHRLYPDAPIYTSKYAPGKIDWFLDADVRTGWLQIFPVWMRRFLGVLRQKWFSHLDLSEYDLVITVTGAEAKCVKKLKPGAVHVSYCHVPTQYYWQMYDEYVKNPGFGFLNPIVRCFFKLFVGPMRKADYEAASRVDKFITISEYAKEMIAKYYKRDATVVHPPVELEVFDGKNAKGEMTAGAKGDDVGGVEADSIEGIGDVDDFGGLGDFGGFGDLSGEKQLFKDYYIVTSRQVNWKRLDLAVKACVELHRPLLVVGEGAEHKKLVRLAAGSEYVYFIPLVDKNTLARYLGHARGYLFPSLEPFGIAPVEALASGCPVIAYGAGGVLDYVKDGKNGILFKEQTVKALEKAIRKFETMKFDREKVAKSAEEFGVERFDAEVTAIINAVTGEHITNKFSDSVKSAVKNVDKSKGKSVKSTVKKLDSNASKSVKSAVKKFDKTKGKTGRKSS